MIIYKDLFSQDELFTDIYPMETIDDTIFKLKGKLKSESAGEVSDALIGGNASAEGTDADDATGEAASVSGIDVVLANRLVSFEMGKKDFIKHIKEYSGRLMAKLTEDDPTQTDVFKKGSAKFVKELIGEYKEWEFYCGESMNPDGMLVMVKWDGETPYVYLFKHGLEAEKC